MTSGAPVPRSGGRGCCDDGAGGALAPDSAAYNFRTDMAAAAAVLDAMQDAVPARFLGKFERTRSA